MKKENFSISKSLVKKIEQFGISEKDYKLMESISSKTNLYYNLSKLQFNCSLTQNSILNELKEFILKLNSLLNQYDEESKDDDKNNIGNNINENDSPQVTNFLNLIFKLFIEIQVCKRKQEKIYTFNNNKNNSNIDLIINLDKDKNLDKYEEELFVSDNNLIKLENELNFYKYMNDMEYILSNNNEEYITTLTENMNFNEEELKIINNQMNFIINNKMNNERKTYISLVEEFNKICNKLENECSSKNNQKTCIDNDEIVSNENLKSTKEKTNNFNIENTIQNIKSNYSNKKNDNNNNKNLNDNILDFEDNEEFIIDEENFYEEQIKLIEDKINRTLKMNDEIEDEIKKIKTEYKKQKTS